MIVVLLALILFALLFPGVLRFLILSALALVGVLFVMEAGKAQDTNLTLPHFDVDAICEQQVMRVSSPKFAKPLINQCIEKEQNAYEAVRFMWPLMSTADKAECVSLASHYAGIYSQKYEVYENCLGPRYQLEQNRNTPLQHFQR